MNVFAFLGNDDLNKREALDAALAKWRGSEACVQETHRGEDMDWEQVVESFSTADLFAARKALILRDWDNKRLDKIPAEAAVKSSARKRDFPSPRQRLEDVFALDNPGVAVFLEGEKWDARSALHKAAKAAGRVREFKLPYADKVPGWICARAKDKYGRKLDMQAARLLQEIAGDDLDELDRELEKLDTFVAKRAPIGAEDVLELASSLRAFNVFDFQEVMGLRKKSEMLPALRYLLEVEFKGAPFVLAQMLFGHFLKLLKIRDLWEAGVPQSSIVASLKINAFIFDNKKFLDQAMSRSVDRWKLLLARLAKLELELKQGRYTQRFEVEMAFAVLFE